jgi:hypothetical protein
MRWRSDRERRRTVIGHGHWTNAGRAPSLSRSVPAYIYIHTQCVCVCVCVVEREVHLQVAAESAPIAQISFAYDHFCDAKSLSGLARVVRSLFDWSELKRTTSRISAIPSAAQRRMGAKDPLRWSTRTPLLVLKRWTMWNMVKVGRICFSSQALSIV